MIGILIEFFVCTLSFETINFTAALEIVATVCLSICLNPISTYYIFGYRRMSVFQRHQFPCLERKVQIWSQILFQVCSHPDLTEIQTPISQYLV